MAGGGTIRDARISEDGAYRYTLDRRWAVGPVARFIMLNPSTADADQDDPTIRRCIGFARSWELDGIQVLNLYALRATNPQDLWLSPDPVGPNNDTHLVLSTESLDDGPIVAAWGANAKPDRVNRVMDLLRGRPVFCLGTTKSGQPKHPLYIPAITPLSPYFVPRAAA